MHAATDGRLSADTSVILAWLNEQGYEVIAFSALVLATCLAFRLSPGSC